MEIILGNDDAKLILNAPRNAQYLSPQIQNEMLDLISTSVLDTIISRIKKAEFFTIMADETSSHNKEFLTLCVRYVDQLEIRVISTI
jgi:uncharacterized protein (UPF0305 family)